MDQPGDAVRVHGYNIRTTIMIGNKNKAIIEDDSGNTLAQFTGDHAFSEATLWCNFKNTELRRPGGRHEYDTK
jgi:hypothetical protein